MARMPVEALCNPQMSTWIQNIQPLVHKRRHNYVLFFCRFPPATTRSLNRFTHPSSSRLIFKITWLGNMWCFFGLQLQAFLVPSTFQIPFDPKLFSSSSIADTQSFTSFRVIPLDSSTDGLSEVVIGIVIVVFAECSSLNQYFSGAFRSRTGYTLFSSHICSTNFFSDAVSVSRAVHNYPVVHSGHWAHLLRLFQLLTIYLCCTYQIGYMNKCHWEIFYRRTHYQVGGFQLI